MDDKTEKVVSAPPVFQVGEHRFGIKLTIDLVDQVLVETEIDLLNEANDPTEVVQLLFHDRKLVRVLWVLIQDQAIAAGFDLAAFRKLCDGEVMSAGWGALVDATVFFIRKKNEKVGDAYLETLEAQVAMLEAGANQIKKTMQSDETKRSMQRAATNLGKHVESQLAKACDNLSTS